MVPLEIFIFCHASSCDKPSISTSLKASTSANSMKTGSKLLDGLGVKLVVEGMTPKLMGFGNRPLPPHRCLPRHITGFLPSQDCLSFAQHVDGLSVSSRTHANACFVAFLAIVSNSVNGPSFSISSSRFFKRFLTSCSVLMFGASHISYILFILLMFCRTFIYFCALSHN
jgi:hypothetical protein